MVRAVDQLSGRVRQPWVRRAAQVGLVAKGVLYIVVALLAIQVATGSGGQAGQQGALRAIARQPFGRVLLIALAVGLAGYALWRLAQAFMDPGEDSELKNFGLRAACLARAVGYGLLCLLTVQTLRGGGGGSGGGAGQATSTLLDIPGGVVLAVVVGAGIVAVGLYQGYRGISRKFCEQLDLQRAGTAARTWVPRLGTIGHLARMVVYVLIGWFLIQAALSYDPSQAVGLDGALKELAQRPYGPVLLGLVALGLLAYGLYCFVHARYVRVAEQS